MPAPNEDFLIEITQRLRSAIDGGLEDPFSILGAHTEDMVALVMEAPARAEELLSAVRDHARASGWGRARTEAISLRRYRDEARLRRERERDRQRVVRAAAATVTNIADARQAREGGRSRRRTYEQMALDASEMTPDQRIDSDSVYLIASGHLMKRRAGRIWVDGFSRKFMTNWHGSFDDAVIPERMFSDPFDRRVYDWLLQIDPRLEKLGERTCANALRAVAERDERNEVKDWVDRLQWDGERRLPTFLHKVYGTPDDEYHTAVGRNWFRSMMARMRDPGAKVDTMPVLVGAQGIHKSQSLEVIGGKWYASAVSGIGQEKFLQELQGALVLEIPELHSLIARATDASHVKAVLSNRADRFRPAWERNVTEFKRTAVLVGTTNERGWHADDTGGRRFWPVHCTVTVDLQWIRENRDQLFAEAKYDIEQGESWWEVPKDAQERHIEAERRDDTFEETIAVRLAREPVYGGPLTMDPVHPWDGTNTPTTNWGNVLTVTRIGSWLGLDSERTRRNTKAIVGVLQRLGYVSRQGRLPGYRSHIRYWFPAVPRTAEESPEMDRGTDLAPNYRSAEQSVNDDNFPVREDTDDIPF